MLTMAIGLNIAVIAALATNGFSCDWVNIAVAAGVLIIVTVGVRIAFAAVAGVVMFIHWRIGRGRIR
jgi:hypothetical protein